MSISTLLPSEVESKRKQVEAIELIDVRTHAEFAGAHAAAARNIPLDKISEQDVKDDPIYLICQSGSRARMAGEKLNAAGAPEIILVEGGTTAWQQAGLPMVEGKKTISLERLVRIAAGSLVVLGVVLSLLIHPGYLGISAFVGAGLVFAGLTDTCGMGMILAKMPWNK